MSINGGPALIDELARERAESALETSRAAWEGIGQVLREVHGLRSEIQEGFARLDRKIDRRPSKHDVAEILEHEQETTAVRNLRAELATVKKRDRRVVWWILGVVGAVLVAWICTKLGLEPRL